MKKFIVFIITAILLMLASVDVKSQDIFTSEQLDTDYSGIVSFKQRYDGRTKTWASELAKEFPTDDNGCISYEYIFTYADSLNIQTIIDKTIEWVNYNYSSTKAIDKISREDGSETIVISADLGKIASQSAIDIFYAKTAEIRADIELLIRFKEGRLKIKSLIRHYQYISADSFLTAKDILVSPNQVYPFRENTNIKGLGDKNVCSLAFINATANVIGTCVEYKRFLNKEFSKSTTFDDDNW